MTLPYNPSFAEGSLCRRSLDGDGAVQHPARSSSELTCHYWVPDASCPMADWQMGGGLGDGSLQQQDCKPLLQGDLFVITHTSLQCELLAWNCPLNAMVWNLRLELGIPRLALVHVFRVTLQQ